MVGEELLRGLAAHAGNESWVSLWKGFAFLGSAAFYSALVPLAFAATPRRWALRLTLLFTSSAALAEGLKEVIGRPRPDIAALGLSAPLEHLGVFENDAFPSGHALMAVVVWGFVALRTRNLWVRLAMLVLILAISFSRLALIRHDLLDIGGGWAIGLVWLAVLHYADRNWGPSLSRLPAVEQAGLWLIGALGFQLLLGLPVSAMVLGVGAGLGVGAVMPLGGRTRSTRPPAWNVAARFVLSLAVAVAARKVAGPEQWTPLALFGIYGLAGLWISNLVPWLLGGLWIKRWD